MNTKQIVIFVAPPGAGKGTQAEMLERKLSFTHLESSKVIEDKFAISDPDDEEINKEKENWATGILVDPIKVSAWMKQAIKKLYDEQKSIVFSGSPRTVYEAQTLVPFWAELYGKENVKVFNILLSQKESINRNSHRRICKKERHPIPNTTQYTDITACPWDGSDIMTRALDKPEVIKERLVEYAKRTMPVLDYFREHDYEIIEIDGARSIEKVSQDILNHFS